MASKVDIETTPISRITDGWVLKNGQLHLEVQCADGVRRYVSIDRDREHPTRTVEMMERLGVSHT